MEAGIYVDPATEYEITAEFVARHFGRPVGTDIMRACLIVPEHVLDDIDANPHEWIRRVNEYLYGMQQNGKLAAFASA